MEKLKTYKKKNKGSKNEKETKNMKEREHTKIKEKIGNESKRKKRIEMKGNENENRRKTKEVRKCERGMEYIVSQNQKVLSKGYFAKLKLTQFSTYII